MKKWLHRLVKLVAWLLLIFVLFLVEENLRGRILLAAYKHHLRAQGRKLTLSELGITNAAIQPDVATVDLFAAATKLGDWNPDNRWEAETQHSLRFMRPVIQGAATFSWNGPVMDNSHGKVVTNGWPATAERLRANGAALIAAIDALRRNPDGVPYGFLHDPVFASQMRYRVLYWLMWSTANNLRESNLDGAGEAIVAIARLGRTFQSHHAAYYKAFMQQGLDATWELLQSGATNDEQLSEIQELWSKGAVVPYLAKSFEAYHAWNLESIEAQSWGTIYGSSSTAATSRTEFQVSSPTSVAFWYLEGRCFDEYAVLVLTQDRLQRTRAIAQTRRWNSWQEGRWPKRMMWCLPWVQTLLFFSAEDWYYSEHMLRAFEFETHREMTVAAIALQRFRSWHGHWPAKLDDLVPELLPTLPRDWMDGQPLRYRRNANDTFTLYSVGEDLRDDGGDPSYLEVGGFDKSPLPMWTARDAVWPCVATDENIAALKRVSKAKKGR